MTQPRLLGAAGRVESGSGRATRDFNVFPVQVTVGVVFCTDNMTQDRLSCASGRALRGSDEILCIQFVFLDQLVVKKDNLYLFVWEFEQKLLLYVVW